MTKKIRAFLKKTPWQTATLALILILGIFLRTYHFHQWIYFGDDQNRDLHLITDVLSGNRPIPLLGPDMTGGRGFLLGPIYYYFQMMADTLFGVSAAHQAYPDWLFSVLFLPLLAFFLTRIWSTTAAIGATAIAAVSFFLLEYSRFAWNVNPIPFFVLLALLSLWQLLTDGKAARWKWIIALGIAIGVGIQLHAILLTLLPILTLLVFFFLLRKKQLRWSHFVVIVAIATILNGSQIIHEYQTNFENTKAFFATSSFKSDRTKGSLTKNIALDIACNTQAISHIISSLGNHDLCDFIYEDDTKNTYFSTPLAIPSKHSELFGEIVSLLFSVIGYGLLIRAFRRETNRKKKYLLGLILTYMALSFLVMIPIAAGSRLRYFLPITFLPFVFLALIIDTLREQKQWLIAIGLIGFLIGTNATTITAEVKRLSAASRTTEKIFGPPGNAYVGEITFPYQKR